MVPVEPELPLSPPPPPQVTEKMTKGRNNSANLDPNQKLPLFITHLLS
jgi:hypothetical protein